MTKTGPSQARDPKEPDLEPFDSRHTPEESRARREFSNNLKGLPLGSNGSSSSSTCPPPSLGAAGGTAKPRALVECCCGPASLIAAKSLEGDFSKALRLTAESHQLGTPSGDAKAERDVRALVRDGFNVHLWASLPCRPWTLYTIINAARLGRRFRTKLTSMRNESIALIKAFFRLAEIVEKGGGTWLFEWPAFC